ncbi:AAA family ATPase [Phycicoccus sp. HDW14]|uniref:AAA family ATPase n=1 Tax=Phycicoccus sp. HDW14 TaxID=2714941 RepID=UPI001409324D|nr:AAA family ATPase [Phycicoccus sp. HDW14]QIM22182.1 AAA family ATPase [Phycicoccus sp. HDW14]
MLRIALTHLTFLGAAVPPASVEFGPRLTLFRGPSDTGKSFIVDAIDFMLGANDLKEIPERDGYSTVLLGLRLADEQEVTLSRSTSGGSFGLHLSDVRSLPLPAPDEVLSPKHNPKSVRNVSRYLLSEVGLDGKMVRKNARNSTDSLSFRNLAHLCLVDETQMQSETPPPLTGQYITRTKEISVLKLLLQAEDDSNLVEEEEKKSKSRLDGAQVEVIDRLLAELEAELSEIPEESEVRGQLARLNGTLEAQGGNVTDLMTARKEVTFQLREVQDSTQVMRTEQSEIVALQARFALLMQQYDSDLQRLATIREAGDLLDYFAPGNCAFCGAEPEHQHFNQECEGDETALHESIRAETAKTEALRGDLLSTLQDLDSRRGLVETTLAELREAAATLDAGIRNLDEELAPQNEDLRALFGARAELEKSISLYVRRADLQRMKAEIEDGVTSDAKVASVGISLGAIREFSSELQARLGAWGYPDAAMVRYDRSEQDIQAGDQFRSSHGKGVRAVLHAAFSLGLAQYCFDRDMAHPGFVVLDSPLVTYRPPDSGELDPPLLDESLPKGVVEAFYRNIQTDFDGQVIVMENLDPTEALDGSTVDVPFTHRQDLGRYGFFPYREKPQQAALPAASAD